jgi:recombinational DNA repair protein RecR
MIHVLNEAFLPTRIAARSPKKVSIARITTRIKAETARKIIPALMLASGFVTLQHYLEEISPPWATIVT